MMATQMGVLPAGVSDWQSRLHLIVKTMREISLETDPQALVRTYAARMHQIMPTDRWIALSRRDLEPPYYRITRSSTWSWDVNPWKHQDCLPVLAGGLLGALIYGDEPRLIDHLEVAPDDPAAEYLDGMRSLMAAPQYDQGAALNMVIQMKREPSGFDPEGLPEWVWMSNLFGRTTRTLALAEELRQAYKLVDRELRLVADIQRGLLPRTMPQIPGLGLAAYYQASQWAGGDYYDFFPLPDGRWGVLIADVSGHGTPAAVLMAVLHSLAHTLPGPPEPPSALLSYVNQHLATRYTAESVAFVTAFYGIFDPAQRVLAYSCAGHNPPRLKRCEDGSVLALDAAGDLPLGVSPDQEYGQAVLELRPGDQIIFYTDGITEAKNARGEMFGSERLDEALENCFLDAQGLIDAVLAALDQFTGGRPLEDDRTVVVAKVS